MSRSMRAGPVAAAAWAQRKLPRIVRTEIDRRVVRIELPLFPVWRCVCAASHCEAQWARGARGNPTTEGLQFSRADPLRLRGSPVPGGEDPVHHRIAARLE